MLIAMASVGAYNVIATGATPAADFSQANFNSNIIASRPVVARLWQQDQGIHWTLVNPTTGKPVETPSSMGLAIGNLQPSWVSEVMYIGSPSGTGNINGTDQLGQNVIASYNTFRNEVLSQSPHTVFDIMISVAGTPPRDPTPIMEAINSQIHVDGFSFDFWWNLKSYPNLYQNAIIYAHSQGQFIVGSSLHSVSNVYPGEDVALTGLDPNQNALNSQDIGFVNNVHNAYGDNIPVVFHITSNPGDPTGNYWVDNLTTFGRIAEVSSQVQSIYSLSCSSNAMYQYSVANPLYPIDVAYDAAQDGNMMGNIQNLMNSNSCVSSSSSTSSSSSSTSIGSSSSTSSYSSSTSRSYSKSTSSTSYSSSRSSSSDSSSSISFSSSSETSVQQSSTKSSSSSTTSSMETTLASTLVQSTSTARNTAIVTSSSNSVAESRIGSTSNQKVMMASAYGDSTSVIVFAVGLILIQGTLRRR